MFLKLSILWNSIKLIISILSKKIQFAKDEYDIWLLSGNIFVFHV